MGENDLENVFDWAGLANLYDQHGFKLWLSGIENSIDAEFLDRFSDAYSIDTAEKLYYDELLFHLRIFKGICKNNDLPPRYW